MPRKIHKVLETQFDVTVGEEFSLLNDTNNDVMIELEPTAGSWYLEQSIAKGDSVMVKMGDEVPVGSVCKCIWTSRSALPAAAVASPTPKGGGQIIIRKSQAQPLGNGQIIIRVAA